MKILIVDDDIEFVDNLRFVLEELQASIFRALAKEGTDLSALGNRTDQGGTTGGIKGNSEHSGDRFAGGGN